MQLTETQILMTIARDLHEINLSLKKIADGNPVDKAKVIAAKSLGLIKEEEIERLFD